MPDHFQVIYSRHASEYDRLVSAEDYQGNILRALRQIAPIDGAVIADLGAGTGRVTRLAAPYAARVIAMDASAHMLGIAADTLQAMGQANFRLIVADNRRLPLPSATADIAIEGWSFGHLTGWFPDTWRAEMQRALGEMQRIVKPGGVMILIETLGTGRETPEPPSPGLAEFYRMLEDELGYQSMSIRTDYRFASEEEAVELTKFFFGDGMASNIKTEGGIILPECTGFWWKQV